MKLKRRPSIQAALLCLAAVFILILVLTSMHGSNQATAKGRAYLREQASLDAAALRAQIDAGRLKSRMDAIENNELSIFSLFDNSMILGDSRALGFIYYSNQPESRVLAGVGDKITNVADHLAAIERAQPSVLYFLYGLNDVESELGHNQPGGYAAIVEEQVDQALSVSPNSKVVLSSILPVLPSVVENNPVLGSLEEYNRELSELAAKRGWVYVDNSDLFNTPESESLYEPDGEHFASQFYPLYAQNLIQGAYGSSVLKEQTDNEA